MATIPESHISLVQDGQIVSLATVGPDGYPQVSAVWYVLEDDGVVAVSLNRTRQKTKNLASNSRSTLFFIDPANPYRTLEIRANAELIDDTDYARAAKVNSKYSANVADNDKPGATRVWARFNPVKINAFG